MGTSWEKGQVRKSFPEWKKSRNFFTPPRKFQDFFSINSIFICSTPLHPWELMPKLLKYSGTIHWQKASGFPRFGVDPSRNFR
jgi:hypothetical protein